MMLPKKFTDKFNKLMNVDEYDIFIKSLEQKPFEGIRYNSLKVTEEEFLSKITTLNERIPWTKDGFYYNKNDSQVRLTIHPYYHQGLFYIQEPSAMFPVELLDPQPDEKVLDLCAAPGGKSLQIACKMQNTGLLVTNEISPKRVKALKKNIELYGIKNSIITNSTGKKLFETYGTYFDKILVDAPCSGEGTFRKDKHSIKEYDKYSIDELYDTQKDILDYAFKLLKTNGYLVYSTCTFNPEENEQQIEYLLNNYDCTMIDSFRIEGMANGRSEWTNSKNKEINKAVRFWPYLVKGEGHFVAMVKKNSGEIYKGKKIKSKWRAYSGINEKIKNFIAKNLNIDFSSFYYYILDDEYYLMQQEYPVDEKNRIEHLGVHIGKVNKYNFIPSQSFAMTLKKYEIKNVINVNFENANKYLKGESLILDNKDGFYGISYQDNILGWAKIDNGFFKNLYEKSWRKVNDGYSFNTSFN